MNCKLISISQPTIPECTTAEELVAYCARVSNPANQANHGTANKLLRYLVKHKHWSPFEMVSLTIEINTTRDIARQILRHRSFSFQEFSQRYAVATNFETRDLRMQDKTNRQNSVAIDDPYLEATWQDLQNQIIDEVENGYKWAIASGIAKEVARAILPEGLTGSTLYMSGTLRSWIHYCQLRCGPETQLEHREVALECWDIITTEMPSLVGLLDAGE